MEKRNLKQELLNPKPLKEHSKITMCQIKMKLNCCHGTGYILDTDGPFTKSKLCTCVTNCDTCHGQARFVRDGQAIPCQTPNPKVLSNLINQAAIPSRYGFARLNQFNNHSGNGKELISKILKWRKQFKPGSRGLLIEGPVGVGKTYILAALAFDFLCAGYSVKFVDFFQLLNELKAGYSDKQADSTLISPLLDIDLLIIDELGKGRNTDWELSIIDQLVMGRYNQNKAILASTNYSTAERKSYVLNQALDHNETSGFRENMFEQPLEERVGARTFSRLMEMCYFVKLEGDDYRRRFIQSTRGQQAQNYSMSKGPMSQKS